MKKLAVLLIAFASLAYGQVLDSEINLAQAARTLSENEAKIFPGSEIRTTPLNKGDTELVIGWRETSADDWPELKAALEMYTWSTHMLRGQKSRFVEDPVIDGTPYPGKWRQARISRIRQEERRDQFVYWIVLTLRSGYAESIQWDEARMREYKRSESTITNAANTANTDGYDPVQYAVIRFPNISPYKIEACMASLTNETYTGKQIYGETLSGAWYNLSVTGGKAEDGSGFVDLILSRQRFTIASYDFWNTMRQSSIYRIFSVPKTIAQDIIDDWKDDGRSADSSYNENTDMCTVTLRDRDAAKQNLTLSWMQDGCDEFFRQRFAWGYTTNEISDWVDVNFTNQPADGPYSRDLSVQDRGDGLFNATMIERKFATLDATAAQISITLPIGKSITRRTDYGYNYNKAELDADAIENQYDENIAGIGTSVTFRVTREDDCSFDWYAEILAQSSVISNAINTGTGGVARKAYALSGASDTDIAALQDLVKSGPRTNADVSIRMQENGLADVQAELSVAKETATSWNDSGTTGIRYWYWYGANADAPPTMSSGPRQRISPNIRANDDGTINYGVLQQFLVDTIGTYDQWGSTNPVVNGANGLRRRIYYGKNAKQSDLDNIKSTSRLERITPSIGVNDDGTYDYIIAKDVLQSPSVTVDAGSPGATISETIARNQEGLSTSTGGAGVTTEILSAGFDDAGNMQYRVRTTTRSVQSDEVSGGTYLNPVTYSAGTGDTTGPTDDAPSKGNTALFSLRVNPDGSREWTKQDISATGVAPSFTWAVLRPASRAGGYTETAKVFRNQTTIPSPSGTYYYFKRVAINDDGTYDGEYVEVDYDVSPADEISNFAGGSYTLTERKWDVQQTSTGASKIRQNIYHEITWTVSESVYDSYSTALTHISAGNAQRSTVSRVTVNGRTKYLAKKTTFTSMAGPYTAGGSWYYDIRAE